MSKSIPVIPFSAGDQLEALVVTFRTVNLALYSSIKLFVTLESGQQYAAAGVDATILDAAAGKMQFDWPTPLPEGNHAGVIKFTRLSDGKLLTVPHTRNPLPLHVGPEKPNA